MKTFAGILIAATVAVPAVAQTRSTRDTATAYGARLTGKAASTTLNQSRINSRIDNRIQNRISLRIERYQPADSVNPATAYQAAKDDKSRVVPTITPVQTQDPDAPQR